MKDNKNLNLIISFVVYFISIMIFNYICNMYNMTTLHRIICLISVMFSYTFMQPLFLMFEDIKKD